jgi:hypothetical protein
MITGSVSTWALSDALACKASRASMPGYCIIISNTFRDFREERDLTDPTSFSRIEGAIEGSACRTSSKLGHNFVDCQILLAGPSRKRWIAFMILERRGSGRIGWNGSPFSIRKSNKEPLNKYHHSQIF